MSRRIGRISTKVATATAIAGAVALLGAGTASASTVTYQAGVPTAVTYTCTFPGISAQPVAVTAHLDAPDSVATGSVTTPANVGGTASISATVHTLLTAVGYDGIRGKANVPVTGTGGTLSNGGVAANLNVPQAIYPTGGGITVTISQDAGSTIPAFTAGAPGSATLSLGTPLSAALEFHKKSANTWTAFTMNCTLKVTSPAQNTAFSPSITITP
ncbi:MAG: hypothetical protein JWQ81_7189 [Amycolatopsis sp.]|jgi:hypothetical protein|uniref:DUF6801 domain-containing protein n=1 Tax=Amycolatopsis sp. TaxID=37632 RepID=UPI00261B1DE3|nr:DUF6801 domain-containing protein [Amycolatopsis sp.]MCU1686450.1 hypothetical protein [Amycolatopsis sp.]